MADAKPKLKMSELPDTKPTKRTISLTPDLDADVEAYAKVYEQAYGKKADANTLIPVMIAGYLASDAGFKKARKELA